jgi:SpoVK/Ycf46/Vps4 family AAA+-type ATPase
VNSEDVCRVSAKIKDIGTVRLKMEKYTPTPEQEHAIGVILRAVNKMRSGVFLIWGPPGTGKTMIGWILAQKLDAYIIRSADLCKGAYSVSGGLACVEEVDQLLDTILKNETPQGKRDIITKNIWSETLDTVSHLSNTIILLTMNSDPEKYDRIDPALLRRGRVTARIHMTKVISED